MKQKIIISSIIFATLLLLNCNNTKYTFSDIESGKIELDETEKNALQSFLIKYKIPKNTFTVGINNNSFYNNIHIDNSHITKFEIDNIQLEDMKFVSNFKYLNNIWFRNCNISKIEGIETLDSLTDLDLHQNNISSLQINNENNTIETLKLNENKLENLKGLNLFKKLKELRVENNKIINVDEISNNNSIEYIVFSNNLITKLDIENCSKLNIIYCDNNKLEYLNLKNLPVLGNLYLSNNNISNIKIENTAIIYELDLSGNNITKLPENFNKKQVKMLICEDLSYGSINNKEKIKIEKTQDIAQSLDSAIYSNDTTNRIIYTDKFLHTKGSIIGGSSKSNSKIGKTFKITSLNGLTSEDFRSLKGGFVGVNLTTETGKVRVYLKGLKGKGKYKYITADKDNPAHISGYAFDNTSKGLKEYKIYIESEVTSATGIKCEISLSEY